MKCNERSAMEFRMLGWNPLLSKAALLFFVAGGLLLSACNIPKSDKSAGANKKPVLSLEVVQVDQLVRLGNKFPDGQYMVAKATMKNLSNESRTLDPSGFLLQNITNDEQERYSQPAERMISFAFARVYGASLKDKVVDNLPIRAYPRLQLDRYFVFMVPADAKPDQYRIFYKPLNISAPLVSGKTVIHDHRYDNVDLLQQP